MKGEAVIVKHTGSHYLLNQVAGSASGKWSPFPAIVRGKLRLTDKRTTNPVAVGDIVEYEAETDADGNILGEATINALRPRKNYIIRKSANLSRESHIIAANLDRVCLIVTLILPETKWPFIDRLLVTAEAYGVPVTLILNKTDLCGEIPELKQYFLDTYRGAGYEIIETSATTGEGIGELRDLVSRNGLTLFSGVSGVGKSTLLKKIDPSLNPRTGDISTSHLQGKHTTTFYEIYPITTGGYIIDTPGIRGFGLIDIKPEELSTYFPEMLRVSDSCRYKPCTHTHEPHCAVKQAVDDGIISSERYNSYLGMLDEETKYRT